MSTLYVRLVTTFCAYGFKLSVASFDRFFGNSHVKNWHTVFCFVFLTVMKVNT